MNYYRFETAEMDRQFLLHEPVNCPAILPAKTLSLMKQGDKIVIHLFNRSKYMGIISNLHFTVKNEIAKGHFEVIKQ